MGTFRNPDEGAHHYEQIHAQILALLRGEKRAFFVMVAGDNIAEPKFAFYVDGSAAEVREFLADVVATAEEEIADVDRRVQRELARASE